MINKEWQKAEFIFHTALELSGEKRALYLSEACSDDDSLFFEVDSLICAFEKESGFLEETAFNLGMTVLDDNKEGSLTGREIGSYQIKQRLGRGGMGDVYLAEDTRLNRKVALKFLKDTLLDDKWAKRQFVREAQAVALLEHPNICAVHNIEEIDEHNFIVMQYIEGATLDQFSGERKLNIEEILPIAHQIVTAVTVAHSHSIIHRDIKLRNIMITSDGQIKMLDFGLAKVIQQQKQKAEREAENTSHISQNGLILGTVSYMSPEQLRGERLDYRSDIFSVGIVLYELLGGQNPFNHHTQAETIAAIISGEPAPLKESAPQVPDALNKIVQKCLNKDKEKRFQSAVELLVDLENFKDEIAANVKPRRIAGIYSFAASVVLFMLILGAIMFFYRQGSKIPTLAVLPITNESGQSDKDYLSVGLTENLINKFSRLSRLKVIAHPLVSKYAGQSVNLQTVGSELNSDAVLIGKIINRGDALILKFSMINVSDGTALLENEYFLEDNQLISVQDNLSSQVITKLQPSVNGGEKKQQLKHQTEDPEALKMYFLGRYYWNKQYGNNMKKAVEYFTRATELDPYYAQAWSGLADSYASYSIPSVENSISPAEAVIKAKAAAKNALEIDDSLCEPYTSLGMIELRNGWNWAEAENNFKKAIDLDAEYAPAHYGYSILLVFNGRFEEALAEGNKAKEFDPFSPNMELNLGRIFYYKRNYEQTARIYTQLAENNPDNARIKYGLGLLYLKTGKLKEATDIFEQIIKTNKPLAAAALAYAYGKTGRSTEALQLLTEIQRLSKDRFVSSQEKAFVYFGLNDREHAFENLNKACAERFSALPGLLIDPLFDEFQSDPRFAEVRKCANLPPA